jgi:Ca2+-binding RTX toxin-like protein
MGGYGGDVDNDILSGGLGNDTYYVSSYGGTDTIVADLGGDDTVYVWDGVFTAAAGIDNIIENGSYGDNFFTGNASDNYIYGGYGDDVLVGMDGNDTLDGGSGDDRMTGGLGNDNYMVDSYGDVVVEAAGGGIDTVFVMGYGYGRLGANVENMTLSYGASSTTIHGNALNNVLTANEYNNTIYGGAGTDTLITGGGADRLFGGSGNDTYFVENHNDGVFELNNGGTDTVVSNGNFRLGANVENLTLADGLYGYGWYGLGNGLANRIQGDQGENFINGYGGNDVMIGGAGSDTFIVDSTGDVVIEAAGGGDGDEIVVDTTALTGTFTMGANVEYGLLYGSSGLNLTGNASNNFMAGNNGVNTLNGGLGNDNLYGGGGNDTLIGGDGNDFLDGEQGNDTLNGGLGNDIYVVNRGDGAGAILAANEDTVIDAGGIDTVRSNVYTYTLGLGIENLDLQSGNVARVGIGNASNNVINGNSLKNTLDGQGGNDTLNGGAGNDTLTGGAGDDKLDGGTGADSMDGGAGNDIFIVDNGGDVVIEGAAGGLDLVRSTVNSGSPLFDNVENLTLYGGANFGYGNNLNNVIKGNDNASTLEGSGGNDTIIGGSGGDFIYGGAGNDLLQGNSGDDTLLGGAGNDNLQGGDGNDFLNGGSGVDVMAGGAGNDTFIIDRTTDVVTEAANAGHDTVQIKTETVLSLVMAANVEDAVVFFGSGYGDEGHSITGNGLDNFISGDYGDNTLSGGAGDDVIWGAGGAATFAFGGTGEDTLNGDAGNDALYGGDGNDHLNGGTGNDSLFGGSGDDIITGGDGNDRLYGGDGNDTMTGGLGDDLYRVDGSDAAVVEAAGGGNDTVEINRSSGVGNYTLAANVENLHMAGSGGSAIAAAGNASANVFTVDLLVNGDSFNGYGGSDTLNAFMLGDNVDGTVTLASIETVNLEVDLDNDADWTVHTGNTTGQTINVTNSVYANGSSLTIDELAADATVSLGAGHRLINNGPGVLNNFIELELNDATGGSDVLHVTLGGSLGNLFTSDGGANLITTDIETLAFKVEGNGNELNVAGVTGENLLSVTGNTGELDLTGLDDGQVIQLQNLAVGDLFLSLDNSSGSPNVLNLMVDNVVIGDSNNSGWLSVDNDDVGTGGLELLSINTQGETGFDHGGSFVNGFGIDPDVDVEIYGGQDLTLANFNGDDVDASGLSANLTLSTAGTNANLFTAGTGDDNIDLGSGNDTFDFGAELDGNDRVHGGGGIDTLQADISAGTYSLHIESVENLDFNLVDGTGNVSFDLSDITGNVDIDLTGDATSVTFSNPAFGSATYNIDGSALTGTLNATTGGGNDTLIGGAGNDTLNGTSGSDSLTGGNGNDTFVFNSLSGSDTITDFQGAGVAPGDVMALSLSTFGGVGTLGAFDVNAFNSGAGVTSGVDADDRIIYDTTSGNLYYDADGNGSDAAVQIATLTSGLGLTADDFTVVS